MISDFLIKIRKADLKLFRNILLFLLFVIIAACSKQEKGDATTSAAKDEQLRQYNLNIAKEQAKRRFPYDTISLKEFVLNNYDSGTYLVEFDKTFTYNIPKSAVIYFQDGGDFILAVIAKSKPTERNIETKNVIGFESSFINLDSTKLGTAFFWLTLFECKDGKFNKVWESEVPIHGGFNNMSIQVWKPKNEKYVELNYEDGIISGHRDYNFFMIDGWRNPPHLLETYVGLALKRTIANINNDKFPDYWEYRFTSSQYQDSVNSIRVLDSIPFYWSEKRQLYITDKNPKWFRKY